MNLDFLTNIRRLLTTARRPDTRISPNTVNINSPTIPLIEGISGRDLIKGTVNSAAATDVSLRKYLVPKIDFESPPLPPDIIRIPSPHDMTSATGSTSHEAMSDLINPETDITPTMTPAQVTANSILAITNLLSSSISDTGIFQNSVSSREVKYNGELEIFDTKYDMNTSIIAAMRVLINMYCFSNTSDTRNPESELPRAYRYGTAISRTVSAGLNSSSPSRLKHDSIITPIANGTNPHTDTGEHRPKRTDTSQAAQNIPITINRVSAAYFRGKNKRNEMLQTASTTSEQTAGHQILFEYRNSIQSDTSAKPKNSDPRVDI